MPITKGKGLFLIILILAFAGVGIFSVFKPSLFSALGTLVVGIVCVFLSLSTSIRSPQKSGVGGEVYPKLKEALEEGFIIYDQEFRVLEMNGAAEKIFEISQKEIVGKKVDPQMAKDKKWRVLASVIFPSLATSVVQVSEASVWPRIVKVFVGESGLHLEVISDQIKRDGKRVFFKLIRNETRERAILSSKNEFINTAAHQLRTPLTSINWALEFIQKSTEDSPEIQEVAREAIGVSERTLKITNDLLDVAKIEEGKFGYKFGLRNINEFAQKIYEAALPYANQQSVSLSLETLPEEMEVYIDEDRLGLAFFNLVDNAIKYNTKNGSVRIILERTGSEYVKVSVRDSGVGIPEEERDSIFKKFYRGSNAEQLEPNGNGLGLFITKNIINRHGGQIGFETEVGRGTTFWFTIPLDSRRVPDFNTSTVE